MPVLINSITYTPELSTDTTDYLLGSICEKITVLIDCKAEWKAEAGFTADDEDMIFDATAKTITWNGGNFESEGFKIGDTIEITGTTSNNGTFTISDILDDVITVAEVVVNETSQDAVIEGKTELTGVEFKYNLIENSTAENYLSLIDGNENRYNLGALDYTDTTYFALDKQGNYNSNKIGEVKIKGHGSDLNRFIIEHTLYVTPFFLFDQFADLQNGILPAYYFDANCLKYIYKIDLFYNISNPNKKQESDATFQLGNTGGYDENFNGNASKYTFDNIVLKKLDNTVISRLQINEETIFEITIKSSDGKLSNSNTKFILNHVYLPSLETEYKNTTTDVTDNFMFDRALQTVGSVAVNGDNFGTPKQVLKEVEASYIDDFTIIIKGKVDLSTDHTAKITAASAKNMLFGVIVQDHLLQTEESDKVCVITGIQEYFNDVSNPGVGSIATTFNFHPSDTVGISFAGMFVEDAIRGSSIIDVDITNNAKIENISVVIKAENGTDEFEVERQNFSFSGAVVQSGVQQINISQTRGFVLATGDPFNVVSLKRRADLDNGNRKKYELIYSFKTRWEDFIQLPGVDPDFYDTAQKFDGFNHNWNRFFAEPGWNLTYNVIAEIKENDFLNTIEKSNTLYAYDYEDADDWEQEIKVFDIPSNTELPVILSDTTVRIEATFTKISGAVPTLDCVAGIIEVEPFEQGGIKIIRQISTVRVHENTSPFISLTSNKLLKKELTGNVFKFSANIDGTKLTGQPKISARIYETCIPLLGGGKKLHP